MVRTCTSIALVVTVVTLLGGCASTRIDPSANADWLLGSWDWHAHSSFEFVRDGDEIAWTMKRARVLSSNPRWGEKAAVEVSGKVTKLTADGVEALGTYQTSDSPVLVGRRMRIWLKREGEHMLKGEMLGAGNEPVAVVMRKVRQP